MRYWMVFDIETVPDAEIGRGWLNVEKETTDRAIRQEMLRHRLEETDGRSDFLKPPFHRVAAIAAALIDETGVIRRLGPVGARHDGEAAIVRDFFQVIEDLKPRLVGWNSGGFDIPTLLWRALHHGIPVPAFYRVGEPYHGYRKRFDEESHLDLMDMLSGYGAAAKVSLDEAALVVGVPGKLGVKGQDVLELFSEGDIDTIRQYCSHDVLTTALIFMHYAYHRGWIDEGGLKTFQDSAWRWIRDDEDQIWAEFLKAWQKLGHTPGLA